MARYGGGHEDFEKEKAELEALAKARTQQAAREAAFQQKLVETNRLQSEGARSSKTRARAKKEAAEVDDRAARSAGNSAKAIQADTAAIEANTKARERANRVSTASKAVYGAQSPQFKQAHALMEGGDAPSQYRLRQIEGVGQRRAAAMQLALQQGFRPSEGGATASTQTRVEAAHQAVAAAEYRLAQATKDYTRIRERGTESESQVAYAAREEAKTGRQSAHTELATAQTAEAAAVERNQQAIQREMAAREIVASRKIREERLLGEIDRAEQARVDMMQAEARDRARASFGRAEQLALPAAGQTAQGMPIYPAQTRIQVPLPTAPPSGAGPNWVKGDPEAGAKQAAANLQATKIAMLEFAQATATAYEKQGKLNEAAEIHNDVLNNPARADALKMTAMSIEAEGRHAAALGRVSNATREAGVSFYPLNQAMHRHGALTSEFIAAASRGEVTLREMGNQALITAGKFGGWTVAATGVYAVAGALGQVAQGAIQASSGTQQAFRVITENKDADKLQKSFGSLSQQFNVPIDVAADAVYRMGQVFHDQDEAVKAAEASLYSYKTGEVDVATSTKNLIAIQKGFNLNGVDLVSVFDQINQAQNVFGIGIGDTEAGLAKAAGTWKAAGGDLNYLLAMFVAIQKATGRGGEEIGTALSRLYYVQHPEAAQKLRGLGVDVDTRDVQKTFQSVMSQARKDGADVQGLASGLLGNQYARMLTSVLADQKTFNDALSETSPAESQGSAQKELARVLSQVDEQIAEIGNHFQRLGEALSRAGAFHFAGVLLGVLNKTLSVAESLVNVFNLLPSPLREGVAMLAEMAVGLALLRRLGATEGLVNTRFGALADPAGRQKTNTLAGLREARTQAYNRVERYGAINVDRAFESDVLRRRADERQIDVDSTRHLDVEDPARKRAEARFLAANAKAEEAESATALSTKRLNAAREVAIVSENDLTEAQKTSKRQFQAYAAQRGWPSPRELDQPNMSGIQIAGMMGGGGPANVPQRGPSRMAGIEARAAAMAASVNSFGSRWPKVESSFAAVATATEKTARGAGRATVVVGKAANGLRGAGSTLSELARSMGPLERMFASFIVLSIVADQFNKGLDSAGKTLKKLEATTRSEDQVKDLQAEINRVMSERSDVTVTNQTPYGNNGVKGLRKIPDDIKALWNNITGVTDAAKATDAELASRARLQYEQASKGKARPSLTYDTLIKDIEKDAADRAAGLMSQKEFDRRQEIHAIELKTMLNPTKASRQAVIQAMADANRATGGKGYEQALMGMDAGAFSKEQQGTGAAVELYGVTDHNMERLQQQYRAAEQKYRNSNKADDLIALNNARNAYFQAIIGETQKELQFELLGAGSEQERRAIFARAAQQYTRARIGVKQQNEQRRKMKDTLKKAKDAYEKDQDKEDRGGNRHQAGIGDGFEPGVGPSGGYAPTDDEVRTRENAQRKSRAERAKKLGQQKKMLDKDIERQNRDLSLAALQLKQQSYEDRQQGREILLNLQLAGTQDPMRQAALRVDEAARQVADASREWGTHSRQYRQALTELRNAQTQQAQAILAGVQADNAILLAQAGDDPVQAAAVGAANARRELAAMLSDPKKFDPNQVKQQKASVIDAERAARNARQQQQQDLARLQGELDAARAGGDPVAIANAAIKAARMAQKNARTDVEKLQALVDLANANNQLQEAIAERESARYDLLKSQTDDPVEQARLDLEEAKKNLKGAKGLNKIKKQTEYNNAKKAYQDAKISDTEDTINFEYQMDKITADEAAKQLEALANMKGISKAKKRELLLQAKQLRDEASGDYELDVGSIRLPSLYEVRRFVQGGQPNASQVVTDNRNFVVNISTAEAATAFGKQLEITNGTEAKAAALSMMMR